MSEDGTARLAIFIGILALMAVWEAVAPFRAQPASRLKRWPVNIGLVVASTVAVRLTIGAAMIVAAEWSRAEGFGLLPMLGLDGAAGLVLIMLAMDFAIYVQHVAAHKIPLLWRLHRVHHCDRGFDVTTAVRFHPLEIIASILYKSAIVALLGAEAWMVLVYEACLSGFALFNHGNVCLPKRLESWVRMVFVTPDYHRVHHSVVQVETDSNYGNILTIWDRVCGTYRTDAAAGRKTLKIGLDEPPAAGAQTFLDVLILPFKNKT